MVHFLAEKGFDMRTLFIIGLAVILAVLPSAQLHACSIFTVVRDGKVLMGNNEDFTRPGVIWFVPADANRYGRVNVGFDDSFAQGSMNDQGLSFDGAALHEIPWEADPTKPTPENLIEVAMDTCATVAEAIEVFETKNCSALANAQIMFADATGDSAVIAWLPETGLSITRIKGDHLMITNDRLEAYTYRCQRFVRAEQVLAERGDASLDTITAVLDAVHQRGPGGFTSYSTIYDLKNRRVHVYNLANFEEEVVFDLADELKKGRELYKMRSLFDNSPRLSDIKNGKQRTTWDTRVELSEAALDRFAVTYAPTEAPDARFTIERAGDELRIINPGKPSATMYPEGDALFRLNPDTGQVSFTVGDNNEVTGLILHRGVDLHATRIPTP
jgi:hypothetical protein